MAGVVMNKAEERSLAFLVGKSGYTVRTLILRLFKNDITPAEDDVVGDYTEATFTGYAEKALASGDWTISGTTPTQAQAASQTFTSSANQTLQNIYGFYLVSATDGELTHALRFADAPRPIANNGDFINVVPRITHANVT